MSYSIEESEEREKIEKALWNGGLKNPPINLSKLMNNYDFNLLRCIAHGAYINGYAHLLQFICLFTYKTIMQPNAEKYSDTKELRNIIRNSSSQPADLETASHEQLVEYRNCQLIEHATGTIKDIIFWISDLKSKNKECDEIIEELSKSPARDCRLYCCGSSSNPVQFLNDSDERIRKVATLIMSFEDKLKSYSDDEKELIAYLTAALDFGMIELVDGLIPCYDEKGNYRDDLVCASFRGRLLNTENGGFIHNFDEDIFSTIKDRRILASTIYELLLEGKLSFRNGTQPSSWDKIAITKKIKK